MGTNHDEHDQRIGMKQKNFLVEGIELCRNCKGTGIVDIVAGEKTTISEMCPTCQGSGRVKIVRQGSVIVEPYKGLRDESADHHR